MNPAEIRKIKDAIKVLQDSGEVSSKTRLEAGRLMSELAKERTAARSAQVDIAPAFKLFDSSFEGYTSAGPGWRPPWEVSFEQDLKIRNPRAFDLNLNRGGLHALNQISPGGEYSGIGKRTKELLSKRLSHRIQLESSYEAALRRGDKVGAQAIKDSIVRIDDRIYEMGATPWDERRGIPESWKDSQRAYNLQEKAEWQSGPYFTGQKTKDTLGSTLLSTTDPELLLAKKGTLPESWFQERDARNQEIEFINNVLVNPEIAQEYAKTSATQYFFRYWSERGGTLGLKEYLGALKSKAASEGTDLTDTKFGDLTTIKNAKTLPFSFGSVRAKVTDIWTPGSPKQSQVGLIQDASGEKMKYTFWKNQQGTPTLELGKTYLFGNVPISEYRGSWGLIANKESVIKEIEPMHLVSVQPRPPVGAYTDIRDYSKPYSIDPSKGTITFTTKAGRIVEMPVQEAEAATIGTKRVTGKRIPSPYDKWSAREERELFNPYAAVIPLAGAPLIMDDISSGGTEGYGQHNAGAEGYAALLDAAGVTTELGGIWLKKAQEAYGSMMERQAAYAADPSKKRIFRPLAFFEDLDYLVPGALDALGGALYPLAYPGQAFWGSQKGIGPMEGIRQETSASEVLNIENPLAALAADIALDPLNLLGIGALSKSTKLRKGAEMLGLSKKAMKGLIADEQGELGLLAAGYLKQAEKQTELEQFGSKVAQPGNGLSIEDLMGEYDTKALERLSKKEYRSLRFDQRNELDDLIFQDMFKDLRNVPAQVSLNEQDWLNIERFNVDIQKKMSQKSYNLEQRVTSTEESYIDKIAAEKIMRGEIADKEAIRETLISSQRSDASIKAAESKGKFPWLEVAVGAGAGTAATASLFSLPPEEQEAGREQVREALKPSEEQGILGTFVDVVSMDSYLEGAAIMNARAILTGETRRYGWEDRITPSIALGIQDKDTDFFSLQGLAGTALDIAVAPTTYLSFGSGAAVKIGSVGGKGAKALKLSKKGVKELKTFTEKYGKEMGTLEFAHHIEQNPAFQKKVLAAGGVNLRGWGQEVNLIPGSTFDPITNAAREGTMRFSLEHPAAFKKVVRAQEYLENKFVVRAAIKRLPRSSRLLPMEADYAEKAMLLPKKVRFDIAQGTERDIKLAKEARKAFGEDYEEIVSNLIEAPVTRESAKLTMEQRAIVEELEAYNKGFAASEKELGLLDTEMSGYLRHTSTPEAKKYLEKGGKKVSTELYTPLSVENKFTTKRTIQGTVADINERARKELGTDFDYFEANPFKATSIRRAESVKAVEQAKFLKWTVEKYGVSEEVARAAPDKYVQSSSKYIEGSWLPKPIAEDIEKEFIQKDIGTALQLYDKALGTWKYGATVTHPAYHATNVIGGMFNNWLAEIDPRSYYRGSRILLGGDKEKVFTTALGDQYTGQELLKMAGESGILSQPGMMDIQKLSYEIADRQTEKSIELAKKLANAPITTAQYEENFIRFSLFNDRIIKGDTVQGAREWVSEFQFQYSKESFTPFERDYMKRAVPFYAWTRGNVPLMGKQLVSNPGKYAQFGKLTNAAVGGQELPQWAEGDLTWMWPQDESTGTFNYMRTPATDLDIFSDPSWYGVGTITPFAKFPAEQVLGFNTYTGMDFDPDLPWYNPQHSATSNLIAGRTGRDAGTLSEVYEDRNAGKQVVKYLTGTGQAATKTRKKSDTELRDAYRKYTGRPNDFTYEQRLALMQRDNWASAQSGISGEFEQLQGGHFYPAVFGGAPLPWNYITQTREENLEWLSAQNYIENLPEREIQQEEAWGRVAQEYSTGVEEINSRTLDTRGRPENDAQKEKKRYDLRKSANIKMYNRQLNTVRSAIRSAEKDLRGEKKKVEEARAKGYSDPASEAQIKVIEAALVEYRVLYEKVSGLRDAEQGKEFELPVQGTDLSRFQPMDIGGYDKYAVRYGKGSELAKAEDIEKLVDLKKITAYYAAMKNYAPVAGFRPGTPKEVKNRILFTRDPRYQELAQIANPLITGAGWEGISGKNYIGPRNISELREVVEGSVSEQEPVIGVGEPPAWYSDQQVSQEPGQTTGFDYNDPEFREVVREIIQETLSEGLATD